MTPLLSLPELPQKYVDALALIRQNLYLAHSSTGDGDARVFIAGDCTGYR